MLPQNLPHLRRNRNKQVRITKHAKAQPRWKTGLSLGYWVKTQARGRLRPLKIAAPILGVRLREPGLELHIFVYLENDGLGSVSATLPLGVLFAGFPIPAASTFLDMSFNDISRIHTLESTAAPPPAVPFLSACFWLPCRKKAEVRNPFRTSAVPLSLA